MTNKTVINMTQERVEKFLITGERTYTGINEVSIAELEAMLLFLNRKNLAIKSELERILAINISELREECNFDRIMAQKELARNILKNHF